MHKFHNLNTRILERIKTLRYNFGIYGVKFYEVCEVQHQYRRD
ncbi:hypothetical protein NIES2104_63300 [Leptolyngbya sp. NIES-2104]|nr:hypothetical protein NIES2104_63300 [Leptolyngbya sp. NIES-2104]